MSNLKVSGRPVRYTGQAIEDAYFCLTDMCNFGEFKDRGEASFLLKKWLSNRSTIEFLGIWEEEHNSDFKVAEFGHIKNESGSNTFTMSADRWAESVNGKCMYSKKGRYGGTYGHIKIAFHLANWLSPQFYFQFITAFIENNAFSVKRLWSRLNYRLHTEGVKATLPAGLTRSTTGLQYASEADMLNIAVFGRTAKEWREQNPNTAGNQRDHASPAQLHVLANLEMLNAYLLKKQMAKDERAHLLLQEADYQFALLFSVDALKR